MAETTCPVADMAREVEALWTAFLANDRRVVKLKDGQEHDRLELENEHLVDRRDALEELAACTPARGRHVPAHGGQSRSRGHGELPRGGVGEEVNRYCRQVDGCLYSVLRLLEELSGTPAEEVGAKHYMSRAFDPHAMLTAALAREAILPAADGDADE
jgi:hypothetical protein